jgi:hypothetical protein
VILRLIDPECRIIKVYNMENMKIIRLVSTLGVIACVLGGSAR